ncbi:hypothetical protein F511_26558 [Dorcoceras hygrometricum]|uniref:Glycine-rich protein n=1 Tax=Dorcoceras hygrometricum TaxID=472368 RepID=A0A2Z7BCN0_9LAMI|nr:hypothetical protein F511_26558 [Dorcoceras hygrometricum]
MAAVAASSLSESTNDGPVLSVINKRLRALRKKLNRIAQMEESVAQGKTLNKEQDETLKSKPSVLAGIDELEKLRQPLSEAIGQEISLALEKERSPATEDNQEGDVREFDVKDGNDGVSDVSDLLSLLYFGSVFDVQTLMRAHDNMITRSHERSSCLTYDYVTDDDASGAPLKELDLDLISMLGSSLISRPFNSNLPHKNALEKCVEHARLWLANSGQRIDPNVDITYAGLREKLDKIMASEYFTTTPAIKATVDVAAAAENYKSFQIPVHGSVVPVSVTSPVEGSSSEYQLEEEDSPNSHSSEIYNDKTEPVEEFHQGGQELENSPEVQVQTEVAIPETEGDQDPRDLDLNELQHANHRGYQRNYRGGRGGGGSGVRRGYSNGGRGGRGNGRGGYQNGRGGQFYDQPGGYYPRNHYNYRGRGGRGMSNNNYNYHASAGQAGHIPAAS